MQKIRAILSFIVVLGLCTPSSKGSNQEGHLLTYLMNQYRYNSRIRPIENASDPVDVYLSVSLLNLLYLHVHQTTSELQANLWVTMQWIDENMIWEPLEYGNISDIRIPIYRLWRPDILLYKSSNKVFDPMFQMDASVRHNGSISHTAPGIFSTLCEMDFTHYPNDIQKCDIKIGSWSHDLTKLNLRLEEKADFSRFTDSSSEWALIGMPCARKVVYRDGFSKTFADITCTLQVRRKGDHVYSECFSYGIVFYMMLLLSFLTPPASVHKITMSFVSLFLPIGMWVDAFLQPPPHLYYEKSEMGHYFRYLFFLQFVGLILNFMIYYLFHRGTPLSNWAGAVLQNLNDTFFLRLIIPATNISKLYKLQPTDDTRNGVNCADRQSATGDGDGKLSGDWTHVACILDRAALLIYVILLPIFHLACFPSKV